MKWVGGTHGRRRGVSPAAAVQNHCSGRRAGLASIVARSGPDKVLRTGRLQQAAQRPAGGDAALAVSPHPLYFIYFLISNTNSSFHLWASFYSSSMLR